MACAWALGLLGSGAAAGAPALNPMFGDHAVLQRSRPIAIWGNADPGERVTVTLEVTRDRFWKPTDLDGGDLEAATAKRYRDANDKVISRAEAEVFDGAFDATLPFPAEAKPGRYVIKVAAGGTLGWRLFELPN